MPLGLRCLLSAFWSAVASAFRRLAYLGFPPAPPHSCEEQKQPALNPASFSVYGIFRLGLKTHSKVPPCSPVGSFLQPVIFHPVFNWMVTVFHLWSLNVLFSFCWVSPLCLIEKCVVFRTFSAFPKVNLLSWERWCSTQARGWVLTPLPHILNSCLLGQQRNI